VFGMLAWLGLGAWITLLPQQAALEPLVELQARLKLRTAAGEIAKTGERELLSRLRDVLSSLGDEERELERLQRGWEKTLASAKPGRTTRSSAASKLRKALEPVVDQLRHINWVCLNILGTSIPATTWLDAAASAEPGERTSAQRDAALLRQALWHSARRSLHGCRAWMIRQVREGRDSPWAHAMLDRRPWSASSCSRRAGCGS
jgi:hypothetical protein